MNRSAGTKAFRWLVPLAMALGLAFPASVFADAPTADDKPSVSTAEDTLVTVQLSGGDTEGDALTFAPLQPSHGTVGNARNLSCAGTPSVCTEDVDYTPASNYNGPDSFTYTTNDGVLDSPTATVSITVTAANDPPTAADKPSETTAEDTLHTVTMSGADVDGDTLTFSIVASPTHGTLSNFGTPASCSGTPSACTETVDYTPDANYNGPDSFTYKTNDTGFDSNTATVSITVTAANDPPTAADKPSEATAEDTLHTVTMSGGDVEGSALSFSIVANPVHGTLSNFSSANCSGTPSACTETVDYTPAANYNGPDSFTYRTSDGSQFSTTATVSISISAVNDTPSFTKGADQTVLTDAGAQSITGWATAINAGAPDESTQTLTFNRFSDDNSALFSVEPAIDATTGNLTFTIAGTTGTAHIAFTLSDDGGGANTSGQQSVTITVDNLVAHNDGATIPEGAAATAINVLANDNPVPNQQVPLTITGFPLLPAHGTVAITGGGTGLTYRPNTRFYGSDSFSYTITHGALTAQATVVVTVSKDVTGPVSVAPSESIYTARTLGTSSLQVRIGWIATDPGSGVVKYEIWRKVDTGLWTLISLPTPTTAAVQQTLSIGHTYQFRVRATDFNGNVGSIAYGPAFKPSLYQESSSTITYSSTWSKSLFSSSNSGGYTRYTSTAGRSATFFIYTRDVAFVAPKSSIRGSLRIYVDNVLVATISEKSSSTLYRQILWSRHWSALGSHRIKIVAVGGARIDLDAFVSFR